MTVTKGKDNIPGWDGSPATWAEYRQAAYMYEDTVKWESRYLCGPRLAAELTGAAKAAISGKRRGWLSCHDGVEKLLRCLRTSMSEPALPEIANQLRAYFKVLRRRRGETMTAFIVRHREEYARTCKAMTRVMQEQRTLASQTKDAWHSGRRRSASSHDTQMTFPQLSGRRSQQPSVRSDERGGSTDLREEAEMENGEEEAVEEEQETSQDDWWWWYSNWDEYGYHHGQSEDWYGDADSGDPEEDDEDYVEILPDVIKGWLLLEKANIGHTERSLIRTEVRSSFSLAAVETALRGHFTDDVLRKRDDEGRQAMFGDEDIDEEELAMSEEEASFFESLEEDEAAFFRQAKVAEEDAIFQIQQGRQTLRDARARQHDVRMGRKFYAPGTRKGTFRGRDDRKGKGKGGPSKTYGPCARCGKAHETRLCPDKPKKTEEERKNYEATTEMSEYVYGQFDTMDDQQCLTGMHLQAQEVIAGGYGVLDGGATRTMASIQAIEMLENQCRDIQNAGIHHVDTSDRPTFGFGNSERSQCISTCYFRVPTQEKPMSLKIHALDQGSAPILISVDTLRKLGAIVDFRHDQAIFCDINPNKLIDLKRSSAGHQLIPLAQDFMQQGRDLGRAVSSLAQLAE